MHFSRIFTHPNSLMALHHYYVLVNVCIHLNSCREFRCQWNFSATSSRVCLPTCRKKTQTSWTSMLERIICYEWQRTVRSLPTRTWSVLGANDVPSSSSTPGKTEMPRNTDVSWFQPSLIPSTYAARRDVARVIGEELCTE